MIDVSEKAISKAIDKVDTKSDYVINPWDKFDYKFLKKRLNDEYNEFLESDNVNNQKDELIDIINMSIFLYLKLDK